MNKSRLSKTTVPGAFDCVHFWSVFANLCPFVSIFLSYLRLSVCVYFCPFVSKFVFCCLICWLSNFDHTKSILTTVSFFFYSKVKKTPHQKKSHLLHFFLKCKGNSSSKIFTSATFFFFFKCKKKLLIKKYSAAFKCKGQGWRGAEGGKCCIPVFHQGFGSLVWTKFEFK